MRIKQLQFEMATLPKESLSSLPSSSTAPSTELEAADTHREYSCSAEEMADAKLTTRRETLLVIESLTQDFLRAIANGGDPELYLVNTDTCLCVLLINTYLSLSLS